jgi:SAM-dependent methyltransferase
VSDDRWAAGPTYEHFMGRWSRQLALRFLSWLQIPGGRHWLDVGCGTGALTDAICRHAAPASVVACDPAQPFIEYARSQSGDRRVSFVVAGAGSLPSRPHGYDGIVSLLALNFLPDPASAVREMRLLAADQGTVAACVWDYSGGMEYLRRFWDAAVEVDPGAADRDEGLRFPICHRDALETLFLGAGLRDVSCGPIEIPMAFAGFDDYWQPLLGATGPAPAYVASLEEDRRIALARRLDASLPRGVDGTIALTARAWAVRGRVGWVGKRYQ